MISPRCASLAPRRVGTQLIISSVVHPENIANLRREVPHGGCDPGNPRLDGEIRRAVGGPTAAGRPESPSRKPYATDGDRATEEGALAGLAIANNQGMLGGVDEW